MDKGQGFFVGAMAMESAAYDSAAPTSFIRRIDYHQPASKGNIDSKLSSTIKSTIPTFPPFALTQNLSSAFPAHLRTTPIYTPYEHVARFSEIT